MTNADKIRAMSDEELALLLRETANEEGNNLFLCEKYVDNVCCGVICDNCNGYLAWLKEEVK